MFEAEFIPENSRNLLIDFNPRYYGQMAFDVARGVPLPWMLHLGATGREATIAAAVKPSGSSSTTSAYCDAIGLQWLLAAGRFAGGIDAANARRWRGWLRVHKAAAVDAIIRPDDVLPAVAKAAGALVQALAPV